MLKNVGGADRVVRLVLAVVLGGLYLTGTVSGILAVVVLVLAVVMLGTGLLGTCLLYVPFKISTRKG